MNFPKVSAMSVWWLLLMVALSSIASGQDSTFVPASSDTSADDPIVTTVPASEHVVIPLGGRLDRTGRHSMTIADSLISFLDYKSLAEVIREIPGVFMNEQGSPGQFADLRLNGTDPFSTPVYADGVPLNDPITGQFDLSLYPVEQVGDVEIIRGGLAGGFASGAVGGVINLVSRDRSALSPYTHIRYSESGHGYSSFDGSASQDVLRRVNVSLGVGHQTTDGRFRNSDFDLWSGRARIRYNATRQLNLIGSILYNKSQRGLNGGVDLTATPEEDRQFDGQQATVVNTDAYEKNSRLDASISAIARFFDDTAHVTSLLVYNTTLFRELRDEENRSGANGILLRRNDHGVSRGITLTQRLAFGRLAVDLGGGIQTLGTLASDTYGRILRTRFSVFERLDIRLTEKIFLSHVFREEQQRGPDRVTAGRSIGFQLSYRESERTTTFLSFGDYERFTSIVEFSQGIDSVWYTEGRQVQPITYVDAGVTTRNDRGDALDVRLFIHSFPPTTVFSSPRTDSDMRAARGTLSTGGFSLAGSLHIGWLQLEFNTLGQTWDGNTLKLAPELSGSAGCYVRERFFDDNLDIKAGMRGRGQTKYTGLTYVSVPHIYVPLLAGDIESGNRVIDPGATLDLIIIAKIGDAHIHFIWENLLDRKYTVARFYPMPERNLRFGISWTFEN